MIDFSKFNDDLAETTDWNVVPGVVLSGSENDKITLSKNILEIGNSSKFTSYGLFMLIGIIAMVLPYIFLVYLDKDWWLISSFGALLFFIGLILHLRRTVQIFDIEADKYFHRRVFNKNILDSSIVPLSHIHALQILKYRDSGSSSESDSYDRFQMNIVLKDGSRKRVLESRNGDKIKVNAKHLSSYVKVPIWDASDTLCGVI